MDSPIGSFVAQTFDDLWRDPKTVTLEAYFESIPTANPQAA